MLLSDADTTLILETVRDAARREIMPRFRTLDAEEKWEKRPGSVVTAADVAAEAFLIRELPPLLPGPSPIMVTVLPEPVWP